MREELLTVTEYMKNIKSIINKDNIVDKSNIINNFNKLIDKDGNNLYFYYRTKKIWKDIYCSDAILIIYYNKKINSKKNIQQI